MLCCFQDFGTDAGVLSSYFLGTSAHYKKRPHWAHRHFCGFTRLQQEGDICCFDVFNFYETVHSKDFFFIFFQKIWLRWTCWHLILQPPMMLFFFATLLGDSDKEPWSVRVGSCCCCHSAAAQGPGQLRLAAHSGLQRQSSGADTRQPDPSSWHFAFRFVTSSCNCVETSLTVCFPAAKRIHWIF